jgi:hypothetical protein
VLSRGPRAPGPPRRPVLAGGLWPPSARAAVLSRGPGPPDPHAGPCWPVAFGHLPRGPQCFPRAPATRYERGPAARRGSPGHRGAGPGARSRPGETAIVPVRVPCTKTTSLLRPAGPHVTAAPSGLAVFAGCPSPSRFGTHGGDSPGREPGPGGGAAWFPADLSAALRSPGWYWCEIDRNS